MPNIKFSYRYRNSSNYKKFYFVIFENSVCKRILELETLIKSKSIFGDYFYAKDWCLPELFTECFNFKIDPTWHEFEGVEHTDEPANSPVDLSEFISIVEKTKWIV